MAGAAGFAAAALRVAARDRWIAWSDEGRRAHLDRVVCLSRFLIRPLVRCPHLASHVLGRILHRLPHDFEEHYGFRPDLVESFADEGYDGIFLRAANFHGSAGPKAAAGSGHRRAKTVKTAFVRELNRSWRRLESCSGPGGRCLSRRRPSGRDRRAGRQSHRQRDEPPYLPPPSRPRPHRCCGRWIWHHAAPDRHMAWERFWHSVVCSSYVFLYLFFRDYTFLKIVYIMFGILPMAKTAVGPTSIPPAPQPVLPDERRHRHRASR